jgi:hypothetical protein
VAPKLPLRPDVFVFIACSSYRIHQTLSTVNTDLAALVPKWQACDDKYPTELNFHTDNVSLQITRQQRRIWRREIPNGKTSGEADARG